MEVPNDLVHHDVKEKIQRVLAERGIIDYKLEIEPGTAKGDNYLGTIAKAKIEGLGESGAKMTLNWIVKCAPTVDHLRKIMKIDNMYKRETYVYERVLPTFIAFQAEKHLLDPFDDVPVFVVSHDEPPAEAVIMYDMKSIGYAMKDRRLPLDVHHVRLAVKAYARFHAVSYAFKSQRPDEFSRIADAMKEFSSRNPDLRQFAKIQDGLNERILSCFDPIGEADVVEKFGKYCKEVYDIIDEVISKNENNSYCVITHGDSWVNNMLFLYGKETEPEIPTKICILDWQIARYGSPAFDLSYFLFTCTDKAFRDLHYHSMMKLYYYTICMNLTELGSDPEQCLPYNVFQNELKRYSIFGINISIIVLSMMLSDEDQDKTKNQGPYMERVHGVITNAIDYGYFDF